MIRISKSTFSSNSRAILHTMQKSDSHNNTNCSFVNHRSASVILVEHAVKLIVEESMFLGNRGEYGGHNCSVIQAIGIESFRLNNVTVASNNCTGITLQRSIVKLENSITLSGNRGYEGGAMMVSESRLILNSNTELNITNNTADTFGGGIYVYTGDETCSSRSKECFYQFNSGYPVSGVFTFSKNSANEGGDVVLGGCLSNCIINNETMSKCDPTNAVWDIMLLTNVKLPSAFVELPRKVAFCTNASSFRCDGSCNDSHTINIYRGQIFLLSH